MKRKNLSDYLFDQRYDNPTKIEIESFKFGISNNSNCTTCADGDMENKVEIDALAFQEGAVFVLSELKAYLYSEPHESSKYAEHMQHFNTRTEAFIRNMNR